MAGQDLHASGAVQERVAEFYRDFPDGSIRTFAVKLDGTEVVFEARLYRTTDEASLGIYTSGWSRAAEGSGRGGCLEECESGAIARALGNLGYGGAPKRRGGGLRVERAREEHESLLEFIKTVGPRVGQDAEIEVGGRSRNLRQFVRENWTAMKEQPRLARTVVEAIERATGAEFRREAA